ncbi:MAG TPA: trigger factor [bacterium]|nr:trigger factor [bacterium]HOK28973.1 trigger factor [bacterium]HOL54684.1 trigger factor [bacterium]HPO81367.1 trigger factor [bacterium]HRR91136.1 trigger factor [bacterium]
MEKEIVHNGSRVQGKISYDQSEVTKAIGEELRLRASSVVVPGFRKGKAPLKLVENFIGRETIVDRAIDRLVNTGIEDFIKEYEIVPLEIRDIDIVERGEGKPLVFTFEIDTYPRVEVENYRELISDLVWEEPVVTEEDVDNFIENIRKRMGVWRDVEDRKIVENGDYVLIDIKDDPSKLDESIETGSIIKIGEGLISPGDDESLVGKGVGESVEIKTRFPEDYREESLRGREITLYVLIKGIKILELPPVDEEFARKFNYQTVEEMREGFKKSIYRERLAQKEQELSQSIRDRLAQAVTVEIPEIMVRDQLESWKRMLYQNREAPEDFDEKNYDYASDHIKSTLALRYIAEKESIEPTEEEVNRIISSWRVKNITEDVRRSANSIAKEDKTLNFLIELIKGERTK